MRKPQSCRACTFIRAGVKIHQNMQHTCDGSTIPIPPKHEYVPTREELNKYLHSLRELMTEGKKIYELTPVHVTEMPKDLEEGKLYISLEYSVAIHLCACGCGGKSVTPLGTGRWTLTDNNGKITLRPSIGNWSGENPYHAHYHITDNKIEWA